MTDPALAAWFKGIRAELAAARDDIVRELQALEIDDALVLELWHKCQKGWAEHDGGIVHADRATVQRWLREEFLDSLAYGSHLRTMGD